MKAAILNGQVKSTPAPSDPASFKAAAAPTEARGGGPVWPALGASSPPPKLPPKLPPKPSPKLPGAAPTRKPADDFPPLGARKQAGKQAAAPQAQGGPSKESSAWSASKQAAPAPAPSKVFRASPPAAPAKSLSPNAKAWAPSL